MLRELQPPRTISVSPRKFWPLKKYRNLLPADTYIPDTGDNARIPDLASFVRRHQSSRQTPSRSEFSRSELVSHKRVQTKHARVSPGEVNGIKGFHVGDARVKKLTPASKMCDWSVLMLSIGRHVEF